MPGAIGIRDWVVEPGQIVFAIRGRAVGGRRFVSRRTRRRYRLGLHCGGPWDLVGHVELPIEKTDGLIARYNDRDDMVMTTISTFASLTVHCARCHDHKFDPISQKDYYSLQAVFAGVDRADRPFDRNKSDYAKRDY